MLLNFVKLKQFRPEEIDVTLSRALQLSLRNNLIKLVPAMAVIFVIIGAYNAFFTAAEKRFWLALASLGTAFILLLYGLWIKRTPKSYKSIEKHAVAIALVVFADSIFHLIVTGGPIHTVDLMVLVMGAGIYLLTTSYVIMVLVGTAVGWLVTVIFLYSGHPGPWLHVGTALLFSCILAYIIHRSRVQAFKQMHLYFVQMQQKQKALEEALQNAREVQERYKRFSQATREGIIIHENARIIDVNESLAEMCGYQVEELIGMNALKLVKPECQLAVQRAIATGDERPYEIQAVRKNGDTLYVEICGKVIKSKGSKYRVVAVRDITERKKAELALKESETWLRLLTRQIPAIHWTTDLNLTLTSVFGAGVRDIGVKEGDAAGKSLSEFFSGTRELDILMEEHQAALRGESREFEFKWKNQFYRANIEPLRDQGEKIIGTIGVALDITLQKLAEAEVKKSLHEKEILLKEIHHRVKNNMQIISSMLTLQARSVQDHALMHIIKESQDRIKSLALVHENLYLSKDLAHLNFAEYVRQLTGTLLRSHETVPSRIQLHLDLQPVFLDLDYAIPCGLIVNELLTNALKYAFPHDQKPTGQIEIKLYRQGDEVFLEVADDGVGLPPDFNMSDSTGLGLQLVRSLIEQIDGTMRIESCCGARFHIAFPTRNRQRSASTKALQEV